MLEQLPDRSIVRVLGSSASASVYSLVCPPFRPLATNFRPCHQIPGRISPLSPFFQPSLPDHTVPLVQAAALTRLAYSTVLQHMLPFAPFFASSI